MSTYLTLSCGENQARGIGQYAIDFLGGQWGEPGRRALERVKLFHRDSVACAIAALATQTSAPIILRQEALDYGAADAAAAGRCFGSLRWVKPEKAVLANCAAVRELDANGTNFGYNERTGQKRGEFGHNDFYPVVLAAARHTRLDGRRALIAMLCLDEIRGRLAEAFGLKDYKIDHVLHAGIASAAVYGALLGASAEQIESAIGMVVAHHVPFRAIRAGKQLSDSKGASAAICAEMAVVAAHRALRGFLGPADVFRNPQALFCLFEPPGQPGRSPFDLTFATSGDDFAIMGMHFKLGIYEHQSAGAIQGLMDLLATHDGLVADLQDLQSVRIVIYEPAFSIIGDPAKRDPRTRQSADHSMVYIIATLLRKAHQLKGQGWKALMLMPDDYQDQALVDPVTRELMQRIEFVHGGAEYDERYPQGIPTTIQIQHRTLGLLDSGLVMYPRGHAASFGAELESLVRAKFRAFAALGVADLPQLEQQLDELETRSAEELLGLYSFPIAGISRDEG